MSLNTAGNVWIGVYAEYRIDSTGTETRKQKKIQLCPRVKPDGSKTTEREALHLLQPHLNKENARIGTPVEEIKTITFDAFAEVWKSDYLSTYKASTQASMKSVLKRLSVVFGQTEMRKITAADSQRFVARMKGDRTNPKTIRNVWGVVSLIWHAALEQTFVDAVLPTPKLPDGSDSEGRFFTPEEVGKIIANAGAWRTFYWLLAETGIRAGELAGLKLVNVRGNCLDVRQSVWNGEEQALKTKNSRRTLVMSQQLQEMVWQQVADQKTKGHDYLFSSENKSPVDMNNFRQRKLKPLLEKLKIGQCGFHAFRHFNISMLDALGLPLKVREERAGHSLTNSITQRVYTTNLSGSANEEAGKKLGAAIEQAVNSAALSLPQQKEPPVEITEALENAA
ncbi:MAG: tyrosine-type recombinase/integrase [Candidatus Sulfotelmatobacter sp.]